MSSGGSSEVIGLRVGDSLVDSQTAALIRGVVNSLVENWTSVPFNKSNNSGHLETFEYVED